MPNKKICPKCGRSFEGKNSICENCNKPFSTKKTLAFIGLVAGMFVFIVWLMDILLHIPAPPY